MMYVLGLVAIAIALTAVHIYVIPLIRVKNFPTFSTYLHTVLESAWTSIEVSDLIPLRLATSTSIPSDLLKQVRQKFVDQVLRTMSPSMRSLGRAYFGKSGFVLYIAKWFDTKVTTSVYFERARGANV